MVQYGIRQATETMQQMTSVERILQYTDLEPVAIFVGKKNRQIIFEITHSFLLQIGTKSR